MTWEWEPSIPWVSVAVVATASLGQPATLAVQAALEVPEEHPDCWMEAVADPALLVMGLRLLASKQRHSQQLRSALVHCLHLVDGWAQAVLAAVYCGDFDSVRHFAQEYQYYATRMEARLYLAMSLRPILLNFVCSVQNLHPVLPLASSLVTSSHPRDLSPASPHHLVLVVPFPFPAHSHSPAHPSQIRGQICLALADSLTRLARIADPATLLPQNHFPEERACSVVRGLALVHQPSSPVMIVGQPVLSRRSLAPVHSWLLAALE